MNYPSGLALVALGAVGALAGCSASRADGPAAWPAGASDRWPQFRGANATGLSPARDLPGELDPAKNAIWQAPLPPGNSSPCTWGESIFLTAFNDRRQLVVLCLDGRDGRIRWEREVPAERLENVHPQAGSPASSTPATDGERVYVFFGSAGVVSFDFQGKLLWTHDLGPFTNHMGWGTASSPVVYRDSVVLNCDHDGGSFLLALDKRTGRPKWRTPRPHAPPSYSTPVLWQPSGRPQIVVAGSGRVMGYDAETGKELWHVELPESFTATTPVATPDLLLVAAVDRRTVTGDFTGAAKARKRPNWDALFANHDGNRDGKVSPEEVPQMSKERFDRTDANRDGFLTREELDAEFDRQGRGDPPPGAPQGETGNVLASIRLGDPADVSAPQVVWRVPQAAPYVPSPLVYGGRLYVVKEGGIISCFAAATGELLWKERLGAPGSYYASPVAGDGKLYLISEAGEVTVLDAGAEPRVLSRSSLRQPCRATPAIAGGRLYVRTQSTLYCFGDGPHGKR